jgi:hypothetical protein
MIDADGHTCNSSGHDETAQLLCLICLNLDGVCPAGRNFHGPAYLRRVIDWHRVDLIRDLPIAVAHSSSNVKAIHGYLGHRSIMSTQRYTALAPDRFKRFWKD